jgi:hypothetical protein
MVIILTVVITGLVMTLAWSAGVQAQMSSAFGRSDQAFFAAESGAQQVAWYCKNGKMASITSPLTGMIGGYAYSATWQTVHGNTIRIQSVGSLGTVSEVCYLTVTPPATVLPTFASGGDFDNKNIDITGDLVTGGNYSNGGSGSLSGKLVYAGSATNTDKVGGGTPTQAPYVPLNMTALIAYLQTYVNQSYDTAQSNKTFDFTTLSGKKVIYVDGDVTNPTFIGSGTLVVNGNVTVGEFGTATKPVNIVAKGDITTTGGTIYGTLYADGAWNRSKMDLTGLVYVNGISKANNGQSSMVMTSPPWFDPRLGPSGGIAAQFSNFAGVQP